MGAIFPDQVVPCSSCGNRLRIEAEEAEQGGEHLCAVCKSLANGDRSLVALLRDPTPERIARFRAAPPGSVLFEQGLRRRGVK